MCTYNILYKLEWVLEDTKTKEKVLKIKESAVWHNILWCLKGNVVNVKTSTLNKFISWIIFVDKTLYFIGSFSYGIYIPIYNTLYNLLILEFVNVFNGIINQVAYVSLQVSG